MAYNLRNVAAGDQERFDVFAAELKRFNLADRSKMDFYRHMAEMEQHPTHHSAQRFMRKYRPMFEAHAPPWRDKARHVVGREAPTRKGGKKVVHSLRGRDIERSKSTLAASDAEGEDGDGAVPDQDGGEGEEEEEEADGRDEEEEARLYEEERSPTRTRSRTKTTPRSKRPRESTPPSTRSGKRLSEGAARGGKRLRPAVTPPSLETPRRREADKASGSAIRATAKPSSTSRRPAEDQASSKRPVQHEPSSTSKRTHAPAVSSSGRPAPKTKASSPSRLVANGQARARRSTSRSSARRPSNADGGPSRDHSHRHSQARDGTGDPPADSAPSTSGRTPSERRRSSMRQHPPHDDPSDTCTGTADHPPSTNTKAHEVIEIKDEPDTPPPPGCSKRCRRCAEGGYLYLKHEQLTHILHAKEDEEHKRTKAYEALVGEVAGLRAQLVGMDRQLEDKDVQLARLDRLISMLDRQRGSV